MARKQDKRQNRPHPLSSGNSVSRDDKRVKFLGIWMPAAAVPHIKRFGIGGVLAVIIVIAMVFGISPITLFTGEDAGPPPTNSATMDVPLDTSEAVRGEFLRKVAEENGEMWSKTFLINGLPYTVPEIRLTEIEGVDGVLVGADELEVSIVEIAPQLTVMADVSAVGCGFGPAHFGPAYCPDNQTIYISMFYFDELRARFGLIANLAQAVELARQFGFHAQLFTGVSDEFQLVRERGDENEIADYALRMSLQADCFAGIWAAWTVQGNLLNERGMFAALNAAGQMDREIGIAARAQGVGKAFGFGSIVQRQDWFSRGYDLAQVGQCNTFAATQL